MNLASTTDEVITLLDNIISSSVIAGSNRALFPVLYRHVTRRIKLGIELKEFDDNDRMERLDVIFANRYFEAYNAYNLQQPVTKSWEYAFDESQNNSLLILQHLLLGINAHINLDLGIAASDTVGKGLPLEPLQNDFNKINAILASLVNEVQDRIGKVSPLFTFLEKIAKGKEDVLATFSIEVARDAAWEFALEYHETKDPEGCIVARDVAIARFGHRITTTKSRLLRWTVTMVRWFENRNIKKVVSILGEV